KSRALPVRFRSGRDRRGVAQGECDHLVAARSHRAGAGARARSGELQRTCFRLGRGPLDTASRERRRRARARAGRRFVRALRLARLGSVSEQSAVRHAQGLRRALGTREEVMAETADALVFFGATGDLAYKKIFPALYAMAKRNKLDFRVIGQGRKPYSREQLIERARSAVADTPDFDARAFERLAQKLDYVAGDYTEPPTFERLRTA